MHNHFSILYPEEDIKNNKPNNDMRQAIVNGMYEEESIWFKNNGTKFFANVTLTALINPKGELKRIFNDYERYYKIPDQK